MEVNYIDVLSDLRKKRRAIDGAIRSITELLSLNGTPPPPESGVVEQLESDSDDTGAVVANPTGSIARDAFFGMSIVEATKKFLSIGKRPKTTMEIKEALESGGYNHTSKNFYSTIFSVLRRENDKPNPVVVKVNDAWGLAEWYPNRRRDQRPPRRTTGSVDLETTATPDIAAIEDEPIEPIENKMMALVKVS